MKQIKLKFNMYNLTTVPHIQRQTTSSCRVPSF